MRWIVDRGIREAAPGALEWVRAFLEPYDTSRVGWIRIDRGRGRFGGVYGRCWYPTRKLRTYRLSCQVPGPFPATIETRRPPRYLHDPRELAPDEFVAGASRDGRNGRAWELIRARTVVQDTAEGIVWIFAHEAFHFLRKTRQVPGRNVEAEADAFADAHLHRFREETRSLAAPITEEPHDPDRVLIGRAFYGRGDSWQHGALNRLLVVTDWGPKGDCWTVWNPHASSYFSASGDDVRQALQANYRPAHVGPPDGEHIQIATAFLQHAQYCCRKKPGARTAALALAAQHVSAAGQG